MNKIMRAGNGKQGIGLYEESTFSMHVLNLQAHSEAFCKGQE
jgi:hypothetical protein